MPLIRHAFGVPPSPQGEGLAALCNTPKGKAFFVIARADRPVAISRGNATAGDRHAGAAPLLAMTS